MDEINVLGMTFTSDSSSSRHVATRVKNCNRSFYGLGRAGILSPGLNPAVKSKLWNSVCRPTLLYGCDAIEISRRDRKKLESEQGTLIKRSLRLGKRSHHSALLRAMNVGAAEAELARRTASLMESILRSPSPCRDLIIRGLGRLLAHGTTTPGTLLHRASTWGIPVLNPVPFRPPVPAEDGIVDSLKTLLCHEHFLKPYSEEHILLRLLTRAF